MPKADFEEKEFEFPLYRELLASEFDVWTPGQVLEGYLGFDGALRVAKDYWEVVGRREAPGVTLARYGLSPILARPGDLPDFSTNLFLQVKRPFEYESPPQDVKDQGLSAPCWYFQTREVQQPLLEGLAAHLGGRAEVAYASPAFARRRRLFMLMRERGLRHQTTFPAATWLTGHGAWHYDQGGAAGVAMSEPERMHGPSLVVRLNGIRRPGPGRDVRVPHKSHEGVVQPQQEAVITRHLTDLCRTVERALADTGGPRAATVLDSVEDAIRRAPGRRRDCQHQALRLALLVTYIDACWLVLGPSRTG